MRPDMLLNDRLPVASRQRACTLAAFLWLFSWGAAQANAPEAELAQRFDRALTCRSDAIDPRDPQTLGFLISRGVRVSNNEPEGLPDFSFVFEKPLRIRGTTIHQVRWAADSGAIFYADATGEMKSFVKQAHASPHPANRWIDDGYGRMPAQFARAMPKRPGIDEFAPLWVIGQPQPGANFHWGCRSFDG